MLLVCSYMFLVQFYLIVPTLLCKFEQAKRCRCSAACAVVQACVCRAIYMQTVRGTSDSWIQPNVKWSNVEWDKVYSTTHRIPTPYTHKSISYSVSQCHLAAIIS